MALPELKDSSLTLEDRVAVLTLKRHDVRNALTGTGLTSDIVTTLEWANTAADASVLIITGDGSAFSAGGNIKTMAERDKAQPHVLQQSHRLNIQRVTRGLLDTDIPVIAAVNGAAIGAGFDLALMCDIRIASTNARFGYTYINLGFVAGDGGGWFIQRLLGYQRAAELTFTGRLVNSAEALQMGIVLEVTEPEDLMPRAHALAAQIAAKAPLALRYAKRLLKLAQQPAVAEHLELSSSYQALLHKTEDHAEAMSAMFEKRPAKFKGR